MKIATFWEHLHGRWRFERSVSDQLTQTGLLIVEKINANLYKAHESGTYKSIEKQTFFRDYQFCWEKGYLNIYGKNPKDGYVFFHSLSDEIKTHTHFCNKDKYRFELVEIGLKNWRSVITITGPKKNLKLATYYQRI